MKSSRFNGRHLATIAAVVSLATILAPVLANAGGPVNRATSVKGTVKVSNFPKTQPVSGTVSVGNLPATQNVGGTVNVGNLPAVQSVAGTVDVGKGAVTANPGIPSAPYGMSSAADSESTTITVPAGKTLVVQTVSASAEVVSGSEVGAVLQWVTNGNISDLFIPLTFQYSIGGDDVYDGSLQVQLYADPGSVLNLLATTLSSFTQLELSVSGYTVG